MSAQQPDRPDGLNPVLARRSVESVILCGICNHAIAERNGEVLEFPHDSPGSERWKGWQPADHQVDSVPGGVWKVAGPLEIVQPALRSRLELLPAIIECPHCTVPNLFDPRRLNVRVHQLAARAERLRRYSHLDETVLKVW